MNITKRSILLSLFLAIIFITAKAGGDGDHTHKKEVAVPAGDAPKYFSSEAVSDKYEVFISYQFIEPGEVTTLKLYLSDYITNKAIGGASIKVSVPGIKGDFSVSPLDSGVYELSASFPEKKDYSLQISIDGPNGADLLLLPNISVGKQLIELDQETIAWYTKPWLVFIAGILSAIVLLFIVKKVRGKTAVALLITFAILPTALRNPVEAHDNHGDDKKKNSNFSSEFTVPKETQFLFGILTQKLEAGNYSESTKLFGTVLPSSGGQSLISAPQTSRITSLSVSVGQRVTAGQILAVLEQLVDAGTQVNILSERNNLEAEYDVAKKEYERLKSIEDIAAKKNVDEARARFKKASDNLQLYRSNLGKAVVLKAPISGIVGDFTLTTGSVVKQGDALFPIINLNKVYVEAQVFDKDVELVNSGKKFMVTCANDNHKSRQVTLLASAQTINPSNQSQRVLFEMENENGEFKIGEFVDVRVFAEGTSGQLALPNSAFTEINGRPAVFVKESAEHYSLVYVASGSNNGSYTTITKGLSEGARVVTEGAYQLKMIYNNQ